jgi:hypothetical protein
LQGAGIISSQAKSMAPVQCNRVSCGSAGGTSALPTYACSLTFGSCAVVWLLPWKPAAPVVQAVRTPPAATCKLDKYLTTCASMVIPRQPAAPVGRAVQRNKGSHLLCCLQAERVPGLCAPVWPLPRQPAAPVRRGVQRRRTAPGRGRRVRLPRLGHTVM